MAAGDVTYSARGSYKASGIVSADADTAVNVLCGFAPDKIILFYKDTGATTADKIITWTRGMTAGHYWNQAQSGTNTIATSGGPTVLAASATNTTGEGFTIPAGLMDADADTIYWEAERFI